MRETVLLVNFKDAKQLREIKMMLFTVKLHMKMVEEKDYLQPLGYLAGVKGIEPAEEVFDGDPLEKEMMIFAGVTEEHLDQMLFLMRKSGVKPVDYKAVLTENNKVWTIPELYTELAREHEAMNS